MSTRNFFAFLFCSFNLIDVEWKIFDTKHKFLYAMSVCLCLLGHEICAFVWFLWEINLWLLWFQFFIFLNFINAASAVPWNIKFLQVFELNLIMELYYSMSYQKRGKNGNGMRKSTTFNLRFRFHIHPFAFLLIASLFVPLHEGR